MFTLLGSALQAAVTAPHRLLCTAVHPYLPAVRLSALFAVHDVGQHILGTVFSPDGGSLLFCRAVNIRPAGPFLLYLVKQFPRDNRFMVALDVILRYDSFIDRPLLFQEIHGIGFLQQRIPHIFFIHQHFGNHRGMPHGVSCHSPNSFLCKRLCNFVNAVSFQV